MNNLNDKLKVTYCNIKELTSDPDNARWHNRRNIDAIKQSIQRFGIRKPIVVDEDTKTIYAGNGVYMAAMELGITELPIAWLPSGTSKETKQQFSLFDNRTAELSSFDPVKLDNLLATLPDVNLDELLWTPIELDELLESVQNENANREETFDVGTAMEAEAEPITKTGDVWICGKHRVMAGDSTKKEDVERLMKGEKVDMVLTDPPYGMNLNPNYSEYMTKISEMEKNSSIRKRKSYNKIIGDDKEFDPSFLLNYFNYCQEIFLWGADYYCQALPKGGSWLVWDKTGGHESLDNAGFQSRFELCWSKNPHRRKIYRQTFIGVFGMSKKDDVERMHPSQKSVGLNVQILNDIDSKKFLVIDPFLGSGTTLIACIKTNRLLYGMEISPHYVDVILKRYYDFTKEIPILEATGEPFPIDDNRSN